jgi:hypothetical protein
MWPYRKKEPEYQQYAVDWSKVETLEDLKLVAEVFLIGRTISARKEIMESTGMLKYMKEVKRK